ncbi:MAG: hypothetical protein GY697_27970 [Desulfobacterales bacterium]|nr:hypothetical protein [Desulfobacterales bacterium]
MQLLYDVRALMAFNTIARRPHPDIRSQDATRTSDLSKQRLGGRTRAQCT